MHPQLELLLQLQDLRTQRRDLGADRTRQVEEEEFSINVDDAVRQLDEAIEELEGSLEPSVRSRVQRMAGRGRIVAPLVNGACYGCFTMVPTGAGGRALNQQLHTCEHCGRFLYSVG